MVEPPALMLNKPLTALSDNTTNRFSFLGLELSARCLIVVYRHSSWGGRKTCQKRRTLYANTVKLTLIYCQRHYY